MDIKFNCPACGQKLSLEHTGVSNEVQCPSCSQLMIVPASSPPPPALQTPPLAPAHHPPAIRQKRAKGIAITSLVLGILGIVPVLGLATGVFGLALGITALVRKSTSRGIAIAGTVLGAVATLMIPIHLAALIPAISAAKFGAKTAACASNMKTIGTAIGEFRRQNGGIDPAGLDVLVKKGLIPAETLQCPLHGGKGGQTGYSYTRSSGQKDDGLIVWDRAPHGLAGRAAGRTVLDANLNVRFLSEDQFRAAPKAGGSNRNVAPPPVTPAPPRTKAVEKPVIAPKPQPPAIETVTVPSALSALKSASLSDKHVPLRFLATAPVAPEQRVEVLAAVKPLLNDMDLGGMAFDVFAQWADKEQVPDLIDMLKIAPTSPRGRQCMKLLSRMGDGRAAEPLAACLTEFHVLRDAKAALAALGEVAKPAVLPFYHHEDRNARETARELLRGYRITGEEIFTASIQALESGSEGARQSAMFDLPSAKLAPNQQTAACRALRPLVTGGDDRMKAAARNAMKKLSTPADADFLLEQMNSADEPTRQFATDLLVGFKDPRAAKPLAMLLADSRKTYSAGRSLVSLGSVAEPAVIPYLRDQEPNTRKRAAEILADIGTAASLRPLQTLEKDSNFFAKSAAQRAVNAIKSRSPGNSSRR